MERGERGVRVTGEVRERKLNEGLVVIKKKIKLDFPSNRKQTVFQKKAMNNDEAPPKVSKLDRMRAKFATELAASQRREQEARDRADQADADREHADAERRDALDQAEALRLEAESLRTALLERDEEPRVEDAGNLGTDPEVSEGEANLSNTEEEEVRAALEKKRAALVKEKAKLEKKAAKRKEATQEREKEAAKLAAIKAGEKDAKRHAAEKDAKKGKRERDELEKKKSLEQAKAKKKAYDAQLAQLDDLFGRDPKKAKKAMEKKDETPTGSDESDTDSDSSNDAEGRKKKKGKHPKKASKKDSDTESGDDSSTQSDSSADSKKGSTTPEWKQAIGHANSKHPRFTKSERKAWKKRDEHRKEAAILFGLKNKEFGCFDHPSLRAVASIETLGGSHDPLKQMVFALRATYGPSIDRIVEVFSAMKKPGRFTKRAGLSITTDGPNIGILVAIHRCQVQNPHVKTVAQFFHAITACPSAWTSKMTDIESLCVETPVTATALGYVHAEYMARATDLVPRANAPPASRVATPATSQAQVPRRATVVPPPRHVPAPSVPAPFHGAHLQGTPLVPPGPYTGVPQRGCNNCGSTDGHWGKNCTRTCTMAGCKAAAPTGVTHSGKDCPSRVKREST